MGLHVAPRRKRLQPYVKTRFTLNVQTNERNEKKENKKFELSALTNAPKKKNRRQAKLTSFEKRKERGTRTVGELHRKARAHKSRFAR